MDTEESLQSILDDSSPEAPKVEIPEVKGEPEAEVETEAKEAAPPAAEPAKAEEKKPLSPADVAAIIDERRKRQAAEQRVRELESKAEPQEKPDFWTDPEKVVTERVESAVKPIKERFFKMSVESAAAKHSDFNDAVEAFDKLIEANPTLRREWMESEDPGEFIYQVATNTPEHREKALTSLKEELASRDQRLAALEAELKALKDSKTQLSEVPKSLNKVASGNPSIEETDDEDTKDIVRFGTKTR
jgi:hypothetical protein